MYVVIDIAKTTDGVEENIVDFVWIDDGTFDYMSGQVFMYVKSNHPTFINYGWKKAFPRKITEIEWKNGDKYGFGLDNKVYVVDGNCLRGCDSECDITCNFCAKELAQGEFFKL